jgi:hypothetical protein
VTTTARDRAALSFVVIEQSDNDNDNDNDNESLPDGISVTTAVLIAPDARTRVVENVASV